MTAQAAYVDEAGRPRLHLSIVGFLDLLGFSHQVTSARQTEDAQHLLDKIVSAIHDSRSYVRHVLATEFAANPNGWAVKFFSDNLVLGYACEASEQSLAAAAGFIVRCAQHYQLRMALSGLFLRGALSHGPICLTDEIIFGSALIECYQLESKAAIVPRVILAEPLSKVLVQALNSDAGRFTAGATDAICRDVDGWWFVNYLQAAISDNQVDWALIERHKQCVVESLGSTTRHDVLPKFGWACRYHNMFCHWHRHDPGYSDRVHIDRVDEQSTIYRIGDVTGAAP